MQKVITVLASPEEAFLVNTYVETCAMIDAITAINERTESICDLLVGSIRNCLIKSQSLCNIAWQLQANMDCLTLFIKRYITSQQQLCAGLIQAARRKASHIIMNYGESTAKFNSVGDIVRLLLDIKQYINAVATIACYQRESENNNFEIMA